MMNTNRDLIVVISKHRPERVAQRLGIECNEPRVPYISIDAEDVNTWLNTVITLDTHYIDGFKWNRVFVYDNMLKEIKPEILTGRYSVAKLIHGGNKNIYNMGWL